VLCVLAFGARAHADDRADARAHYQSGVKLYSGGDYRGAIREFSAAQQIAPADLNNYNLALCYDKLGDAEPAVQYYRAFLDRQPNTDKRAEIEASISRLEAASKSAASKKAPPPAPAPVKPEPPAGPVLGPAAPPEVAAAPPPAGPVLGPPAPSAEPAKPAPTKATKGVAVAGSIGTPSSAQPVPTGDAQLDRVQAINIDEIRDQRMPGAPRAADRNDRKAGPAPAGPAVAANDQAPDAAPPPPATSLPPTGGTDQPALHKETPVYKKWWFWAVVAVSGYVAYELITADSSSSRTRNGEAPPKQTGLTLFSW
jgi:hypothetical protein